MGSVVISLDAELGWGFHHEQPLPAEQIRDARTAWGNLLDLFDTYDVPATWAVVGHLLLEGCDGGHAGHPAGSDCCLQAPDGIHRDDLWFDNGLVDRVVNASVDHELAAHGFSHVHFKHERMTRELAESECRATVEAFVGRDHDPYSFVFPVNEVGFRDLLTECGFGCYRGPNPNRPGAVQKFLAGLRATNAPPIVRPAVDEFGLVNVPASLYLFGFEGPARRAVERVRDDPIVSAVQSGIDAIEGSDGVLHLWLHPHNVREDRDRERMRRVLTAVDRARNRGGIEVETMAAVARRTAASHDVVEKTGDLSW